jgi:hypothetical protein
MPLTVNVGISRKSSANYQSTGVSINLTAELDQSLLADPPRLQTEIDRIYAQAKTALERKATHDGMRGVTAEPGVQNRDQQTHSSPAALGLTAGGFPYGKPLGL